MAASVCSPSLWATVIASPAKGAGHGPARQGAENLQTVAKRWPTPNVSDGEKAPNFFSRGEGNPSLPYAAKTWATPKVSAGGYTRDRGKAGAERPTLAGQASLWSTPSVADITGGRTSRSGARKGEVMLNGQAKALSSRQVPATSTTGEASSNAGRKLNPLFVAWLMGWPRGWTSFDCSATALFHFKRRMRCALSQLASPEEAPAQLRLFG